MNFNKLEEYMDFVATVGYHNASLIVAKDGETVFSKSVGFKDSQNTIPAGVEDQFWIYSCTKPLLCTAAMTLVEQGKISVSDPVSKYLPEYAEVKVLDNGELRKPKTEMTIEHLFTMSSGLTYNIFSDNIQAEAKNPNATTRSIVASFAKDPLIFDPGIKFNYSLSHDVLGAVIEVVTGETLANYMKRVLFDPLKMNRTGFNPDADTLKNLSPLYMFDRSDYTSTLCADQRNVYRITDRYESGGAGIYSCAEDYIKVLKVLSMGGVSKDGYQLLKPETVQAMGVNRLSKSALGTYFDTRLYGYGWGYCGRCHMNPHVSNALTSIGEFGWDGAANDFALVDPNKHLALFFSTGLHGCNYGYHMIHPTLRNLAVECTEN